MHSVIQHPGRLEMHYAIEGSYYVINTQLPVFDPLEPTIAEIIGDAPVFALVDKCIANSYGEQLRNYFRIRDLTLLGLLTTSGAEQDKTQAEVERITDAISDAELPREGVLLAIGGGVTLDKGGLAAAQYRRGIRCVRVATTLVSIVDVIVGIKHGVNQREHKNRIGSFYPAAANIGDRSFLRTLAPEALAAGCAEILKIALIRDPDLFVLVEHWGHDLVTSGFQDPPGVADDVIARAQLGMMYELASNLYEHDRRRAVDLGHTFSPVIEARSGYRFLHGLAVGIDMLLSTHLAIRRHLCDIDVLDRLMATYQAVGLPLSQNYCGLDDLFGALESARRHRGALNLVIPTGIGNVTFIQKLEREELAEALAHLQELEVSC